MTADELSSESITSALTGTFGRDLRVFDTIGSTNDGALEWASQGAPEGAVVAAAQQTQGRGRWSRTWFSPPGASLSISVVLRPRSASHAQLVTTAVGVAVADALEAASGLTCGIKWPNDVVVDGRKVAGILAETRSTGTGPGAVVAGIGVNVAWSPGDMPPELREDATSLVAAGAGPLPRAELLALVVDSVERWYLRAETEPGAVVGAATERSTILGRVVSLRSSTGALDDALAVKLDDDGSLVVDVAGETRTVLAGEVERVRPVA